jgi:hypothetical protein
MAHKLLKTDNDVIPPSEAMIIEYLAGKRSDLLLKGLKAAIPLPTHPLLEKK